jgi:hypothetical protein
MSSLDSLFLQSIAIFKSILEIYFAFVYKISIQIVKVLEPRLSIPASSVTYTIVALLILYAQFKILIWLFNHFVNQVLFLIKTIFFLLGMVFLIGIYTENPSLLNGFLEQPMVILNQLQLTLGPMIKQQMQNWM